MKKIAVTYDNGQVFQHFGHTETFKVYEVEGDQIVSSSILGSDGQGHSALAGLLSSNTIDVLICGGIGEGAQTALKSAGIELCSGASGDADAAVESYLKGELVNAGTTCDHHGEEHTCGQSEGGCGSHCGGGCHQPAVLFEGKNAGKTVRVHYRGTFDDGTQFDSSYDRGEPLEFICATGMMIPGFDKAVAEMEVGEKKQIHLMPEEAYGMPDPRNVLVIEIATLPGSENLEVGRKAYLTNQMGQPFPVVVTAKDDVNITLDANHEMAGKELNFLIELVEIVSM